MKIYKPVSGESGFKIGRIPDKAILWMMTLPFILQVFIFNYFPIYSWYTAFIRYIPGVPLLKSEFVGLRYFTMFFSAGEVFESLKNTLAMGFLGILFSPLPIVFAILINEAGNMRARKLLQTAASIPNFISYIITYSIFFTFFSLNDGVVNNILLKTGIISSPLDILGNPDIVWLFQAGVVNVWKTMGWTAIIYISTITSIDQELYAAAKVDGCGRWKQILHITVPGIMPTYAVLLLLSISNMLSGMNFEQVYVFSNPMVSKMIQTIDLYTYKVGLQMSNFSIGTAVGIVKSVASLTLLFTFNGLSRKLFDKSLI